MGNPFSRKLIKRRSAGRSGFTLAEMLIALLFFGIAIPGVLLVLMHTSFVNEASRSASLATMHAQYVLENIRNTDFTSISSGIGNGTWDWNATQIQAQNLTALQSEQIDTAVSGSDLLTVTVNVTWVDEPDRNRSLSMQTVIGQP